MGRRRWAAAAVAATGAGVVGAAALATADRRLQLERQARIWRLTARRALHFAGVRVRAVRATDERRAELETQFAIRSAEDVAAVLGGMKGAVMKAGQLLSFLADGLPPEAQAALGTLLADVPPMSPRLAAGVVRAELGADPERVFLEWGEVPVAAASIGQVHRAVTRDGRVVAVKVQYPGIDRALRGDLDNAELLYGLFGALRLKNLDVHALVDELRARMADELDYGLEAAHQTEFADLYRGHPFVHVPAVLPDLSSRRVLTSEWVGGKRWEEFLAAATPPARQRAAEVIYRFSQGSIHRHGVFNGDPHPGNYRFHDDGSVTFLDFGLVKRWVPGEWDLLAPVLDAVLAGDAARAVEAMVDARFLPPDHGLAAERVWEYVSTPYIPLLTERFRYTQAWVAGALQTLIDVPGRYSDLVAKLDMPASFVILDRVVWGVSGVLGRLEAEAGWRAIVAEYRTGAPPSTPLGEEEAKWWARRPRCPRRTPAPSRRAAGAPVDLRRRSTSSIRLPNGSSTYACSIPATPSAAGCTSTPMARRRPTKASRPRTAIAGWALRAGRKPSSTPRWTRRPPRSNQHPPRAASAAGLSTRGSPSTVSYHASASASPPGGIASCTWSRPTGPATSVPQPSSPHPSRNPSARSVRA